jgi:hypothetical protein
MTTIGSAATTMRAPGVELEVDEAQLAAVSFLPATAEGRSRRTATTGAASSSGPPTTASPSWRRAVRTSSCSAPGWRTAGSRRRRSTVDSRGSVALPVRTHRQTHRLEPSPVLSQTQRSLRTLAGWTAPSSACSCLLRSSTTGTTLRLSCCSGERPARERGLCHQHRRPRLRARPSHVADRGQGHQARHRAARIQSRPDDRPGRR